MLDRIQNELKLSLKQRNELRTSVLRMLLSELKYAQIEKRAPLEEGDSLAVVQRAIKKRKEAIEMYVQAGRQDRADLEAEELKVLQEFSPEELDERVVREKITELIAELGAQGKKDMGRVMKEMMSRYRGQVDGKEVQKIVSELLG